MADVKKFKQAKGTEIFVNLDQICYAKIIDRQTHSEGGEPVIDIFFSGRQQPERLVGQSAKEFMEVFSTR
jgi:hypothetical protein